MIGSFMATNQPSARRVDDRCVLSGIIHALNSGARWRDCLAGYVPPTTVYDHLNRWSTRGFWHAMLATLAKAGFIA